MQCEKSIEIDFLFWKRWLQNFPFNGTATAGVGSYWKESLFDLEINGFAPPYFYINGGKCFSNHINGLKAIRLCALDNKGHLHD